MSEETPIQFPNYQPPANPNAVPQADPKFHKPLYKMLTQLLRPRNKTPNQAVHVGRRSVRTVKQKKVKYW